MVVNPAVPATVNLQNITISGSECYNALQTITVAGSGSTFTEYAGASVTMIAGENILYYPGTNIAEGSYMHGYITPGGPWCSAPAKTPFADGMKDAGKKEESSFYRVYPNPTTGMLQMELNAGESTEKVQIEIYDMKGERFLWEEFSGEAKHGVNLSGRPAGMYLIRVITESNSGFTRIVKQN